MELKSVFLGENGLTTTSAQHVKDMAGHYIDDLKQKLNSITFVNTNISIIGSDNPTLINKGWSKEELNSVNQILIRIAKAQSLQAWLGEAIKARKILSDAISEYTLQDFIKEKGLEPITYKKGPNHATEEEWINTLTIKERNRYLTLETACAVIGNFIHPSKGLNSFKEANFHSAREAALKFDKSPFTVNEKGQDTVIYNYLLSIPLEDIDKKYFELQAIHRQYQAELNAFKHQFDIYRDNKYLEDQQEYYKSLQENNQREREYTAQYDAEVERLKTSCSQLKIIIPDALNDIYTEINNLGK